MADTDSCLSLNGFTSTTLKSSSVHSVLPLLVLDHSDIGAGVVTQWRGTCLVQVNLSIRSPAPPFETVFTPYWIKEERHMSFWDVAVRYRLWREKDFEGLGSLTSYIYVFSEVLEDAGEKYILGWEQKWMPLDVVLASHYLLCGSSVIMVSWRIIRPHGKYVHNINCGPFLTVDGNLTHVNG